MGNAEPRGDVAGVVDVLARAARALAMRRRAVVVELHRQADDIIALARQQRRDDAGIDAARHRDDDARIGRGLRQAQRIERALGEGGGERGGQDVHPVFQSRVSIVRIPWGREAATADGGSLVNRQGY